MRITADTNVLVRAVVADDPAQSQVAIAALRAAEQIAVAVPALCEFVWVLRRVYAFPVAEISAAIRALMEAGNVSLDRAAVEAGLLQLVSRPRNLRAKAMEFLQDRICGRSPAERR